MCFTAENIIETGGFLHLDLLEKPHAEKSLQNFLLWFNI